MGTLCHLLPGGRIIANEKERHDAEDLWNVPRGRIHPTPGHHTVALFEAFCTPSPSENPDRKAIDTLQQRHEALSKQLFQALDLPDKLEFTLNLK